MVTQPFFKKKNCVSLYFSLYRASDKSKSSHSKTSGTSTPSKTIVFGSGVIVHDKVTVLEVIL